MDAEHVVFRRRREDWLSDSEAAVGRAGGAPAVAAREAALELGKAVMVARDRWTGDHTDDVSLLCEELARELELDPEERADLLAAAQLHDIGKLSVPQELLQKPGPLDDDEWRIMREHTPAGERIIAAVPALAGVAKIVRHSHEHWDGSGYPDGLKGDEIPLASRIVLCADAFHAVRSPRPYRAGRPAREALEELRAYAGTQFDPAIFAALERVVARLRASGSGRFGSSGRAVLRSRRLAALLLALTIAGTAFAALSGRLSEGDEAVAGPAPSECVQDCNSPKGRARSSELVGLELRLQHEDGPGALRLSDVTGVGRARSLRARDRAAALVGVGSDASGGGANAARSATGASSAGGATGSTSGSSGDTRGGHGSNRGGRGHGHAYGHRKRLLNPHPPKLPPGRLKPKRAP